MERKACNTERGKAIETRERMGRIKVERMACKTERGKAIETRERGEE